MSSGNGQTPPWSEIVTGAEFIKDHAPPDWLIDGVVQKGRLCACTSPSTHGKTAVWTYNSCMIQAGRRIAGLDVARSNVLYLAGENPDDVRARFVGMKKELSLRDHELPYVLPAAFALDEDGIKRLETAIAGLVAVPLGLIVFDTGAAYSPVLDENANQEQLKYGRALRHFTGVPGHPTVMALCHPTKRAGADDLMPRGGVALYNELDTNLTLYGDPGATATLGFTKLRGPPFTPFTYRLREIETGYKDKKEREEKTVLAEPMDDFEAFSRHQQTIDHEDAVLKAKAENPGCSMGDIAKLVGIPKYQVQRAYSALEKAKLMKNWRNEWQVTDAGETFLENKDL